MGVRKSFIAGALAALLALGGAACEDVAQDGGTETPADGGAES